MNEDVKQELPPPEPFEVLGVINFLSGNEAYVLAFRNKQLDDPVGLKLPLSDFPEGSQPAKDKWFTMTMGSPEGPKIKMIPNVPYTEEEAKAEYERLMRELPDDF